MLSLNTSAAPVLHFTSTTLTVLLTLMVVTALGRVNFFVRIPRQACGIRYPPHCRASWAERTLTARRASQIRRGWRGGCGQFY